MATKTSAATKTLRRAPVKKRTSQGTYHKPKSKHARKGWKMYRGQGHPG